MKEILETVILNLVNDKEAVKIEQKEEGKKLTFEVKVAAEDVGRIIGKQGKIANSIRTLMKSVGAKEQKRVNVEFLD